MLCFLKRSQWRSTTYCAQSIVRVFACRKRWTPGGRFSKVPRTFRTRKAIRKTTTCLFCKTGLLICCKRNKNKNNYKVSCLETPSFWRYKENYVTRNTPEKFRDFRETGPWTCFEWWFSDSCLWHSYFHISPWNLSQCFFPFRDNALTIYLGEKNS